MAMSNLPSQLKIIIIIICPLYVVHILATEVHHVNYSNKVNFIIEQDRGPKGTKNSVRFAYV